MKVARHQNRNGELSIIRGRLAIAATVILAIKAGDSASEAATFAVQAGLAFPVVLDPYTYLLNSLGSRIAPAARADLFASVGNCALGCRPGIGRAAQPRLPGR